MKFGDVIQVRFPRRKPVGREQEGLRPCVVITNPDTIGRSRYPALIVVPLTTTSGAWVQAGGALYPSVESPIMLRSGVALLDQIQMIDVYRIEKHYGTLSVQELEPIRAGLKSLFADVLEVV